MKILHKIKKDKFLLGLMGVVFLVLVIRLWQIDNLFTFKMDQARDIKLVEEAYNNGAGELPLLGPRAAKTYLRLGPIFYYFEYLSMKLTGNKSPLGVVWPDLIFSILTIPLFYYFLRQAFNKKISFLTTVVLASSFFLNQYGRFAWNPNSIPFWSILLFLSIYKIATNKHKKGKWLLLATLSYGVASQLHFTAMLAYPVIIGLFLFVKKSIDYLMILKRKKFENSYQKQKLEKASLKNRGLWLGIDWKYWLGAVMILGVMYLPMILSEVYTHGDNWRQFQYALSGRGKPEFSLMAKIKQSLKLHSEYFWFSLTSMSKGANTMAVVLFMGIVSFWGWKLLLGLSKNFKSIFNELILNFKKKYILKVKKSSNSQPKIVEPIFSVHSVDKKTVFFVLVSIWFLVMFLLYTKLAFNVLKPRYWLLEVPIFFIFLAFLLERIFVIKNSLVKVGGYLLIIMLVGMNLYATGSWYWMLQNQRENNLFGRSGWKVWELKLKDENMVSYGQLEKVVDYLMELKRKTNKNVCFYTTGEYRPVYDYLLNKRGLKSQIRRISFGSDNNEKCLFVTIDHQQRREIPRIPKKYKKEFEKVVDGKKEIGFITIWRVTKKIQDTNNKKQTNYKSQKLGSAEGENNKQKMINSERKIINRNQMVKNNKQKITDGKLVGDKKINTSFHSGQTKKLDQAKPKKPRRKERVRWKDLFRRFLFK